MKNWRVGMVAIIVIGFGTIFIYAQIRLYRNESFIDAVGKNDLTRAEQLLQRGADPNFLFDGSTSAFWLVVDSDNLNGAKFLLTHGADVNLISNGETPLDGARSRAMKDLLQSYGAKNSRELK